ncbi:c-type cytochrome [Burkholderia sp. WSM2232]|uniref:c-type cytochrome n=1 Tax=Burkholderia sp. WSM2232 TaxID=944436 RepID=UPI0003FBD78E|nr:c-type cytochrome [Burkholderia sp. WSM2232]
MSEQDNANAVRAREHAEPVERRNPVPWLLGLVAAALAVWGVSYFLLNPALGLGSDSGATSGGTGTVAATPATPNGALLFTSRCASCHQATGEGLPGVFPSLAGSEWVNGDPKVVARILLLGVTGKITVAGSTFNGSMPAFGTTLSDAAIAAVASHVRSSFGNHSAALSADVVKAERAAIGSRTAPWAGEDELKRP